MPFYRYKNSSNNISQCLTISSIIRNSYIEKTCLKNFSVKMQKIAKYVLKKMEIIGLKTM